MVGTPVKSTLGDFYKDKRVFITGHTGFKGAWLSLYLRELGAVVSGYALGPTTEPSLYGLASLGKIVQEFLGDVRDITCLKGALLSFAPDIVIHMAAQSLVRPSYDDPLTTFSTNVMGTVNLLEVCRMAPSVRAIVNVTSDKCYDEIHADRPYTEADPMGGHDPYSASKGCAELVGSAYLNSFFNGDPADGKRAPALASARAGNVIGGGDWATDRLVPDCIRAFMKSEEVVIRRPGAVRPWQHVLEPLSGYLFLTKALYEGGREYSGPWNFGPSDSEEGVRPVKYVVEALASEWGKSARWSINEDEGPREAPTLMLDSTKAETKLGWRPTLGLSETIRLTAAWYGAYAAGDDLLKITLSQIRAYEERREE